MRRDKPDVPASISVSNGKDHFQLVYRGDDLHKLSFGYQITRNGTELFALDLQPYGNILKTAYASYSAALKKSSKPDEDKTASPDGQAADKTGKPTDKKDDKGQNPQAPEEGTGPGGHYEAVFQGRNIYQKWVGPLPLTNEKGEVLQPIPIQGSGPTARRGKHRHDHRSRMNPEVIPGVGGKQDELRLKGRRGAGAPREKMRSLDPFVSAPTTAPTAAPKAGSRDVMKDLDTLKEKAIDAGKALRDTFHF
jgi:hypothetical protein